LYHDLFMPGRNVIKTYLENGIYHIYNRGVNKNLIFQDEQDYAVFLSYLKQYLLPKNEDQLMKTLLNPSITYFEKEKILRLLKLNNFSDEIKLLAYCIMPNHFHFLLQQKSRNGIDSFMNSLGTRYTQFNNKKYQRVGPLYQSVYKAISVETDEQLLHLSRYIHQNPLTSYTPKDREMFALFSQPSSLPEYLGQRKTEWIHSEVILAYFSKTNPKLSYESFVNQTEDLSIITKILIDL